MSTPTSQPPEQQGTEQGAAVSAPGNGSDRAPVKSEPGMNTAPGAPRSGAPAVSLTGGRMPAWGPWLVLAVAVGLALAVLVPAGVGTVLALLMAVVATGVIVYAWSRAVESRRQATDRVVTVAVSAAFVVAIAPLVSLMYTVISKGAARFDAAFFTESMRGVVGEGGGGAHAVVGTLVITGVATLISVPIGVMAAIYLNEYGKGRLKRALTFFVDVMTGIPSIVAGLFAFALFTLFFGPGIRLGVMGAVALSVLMIPIVVRSTEEMLRIVPNHLREASLALGVPKWKTVVKVVLPTAFAGIVTGVMLSIARIVGETAPLLVTTGVFSSINTDPFDGRMQNLAVFAFNEYSNPSVPPGPSIDRAWAAALTLIVIVMVLSLLARFISHRFGTKLN